MFQMRGPLMRDENYDVPTATIRMQLKDIAIIDAFAGGLDCALPVYAAASQIYHAGAALGRITGRVDVENLLDIIFGEFCIGK